MFRRAQRTIGAPCLAIGVLLGLACRPVPATPPATEAPASPVPPVKEATLPAPDVAPAEPRPPLVVYRSEVDRALARGPGYLLAQLGPEPFRVGGHVVGWTITRVFPDEPPLAACDLKPGDVVLSVNGDRLATPTALSSLIERLPELDTLEVQRLRHDQREVIRYTLVEDR